MTLKILKKLIGDAGAGMDESHGSDRLYGVLKALVENHSESLNAYQATIAAATISAMVVDAPCKLGRLRTSIGTTGTADSTTVQVHINGVSKGELTTANTEADGTKKSTTALGTELAAGDLLELVVSAAPTGGVDLIASVKLQSVSIEA